MLGATVAALVWANCLWPHSYESFWSTALAVEIGHSGISHDLRWWVNEGLMTLYFLVVGLEGRRELEVGQLRERWTVRIALVAAIGGMATAVAVYLAFNAGGPGARGWGAAMSTDTAFLLGVLALAAPGGTRLRVRLLTLALFDDLVALVVIAVVYTESVSVIPLLAAIGLLAVLAARRYPPGGWPRGAAGVVGMSIWVALSESGIDPVVGGLAIALDELRDRSDVCARQRGHPVEQPSPQPRRRLADHARHLPRLRAGQADRDHGIGHARSTTQS